MNETMNTVTIDIDTYNALLLDQNSLDMLREYIFNNAELSYSKKELASLYIDSILVKAIFPESYRKAFDRMTAELTKEGEGEQDV